MKRQGSQVAAGAGALSWRLMSGAGNTFVVFDGRELDPRQDLSSLARELCGPATRFAHRPDGLIVVAAGRTRAECRMHIWNADGSVPETCGNGLRCTAKHAYEAGLVEGADFVIHDGAGPHPCVAEVVDGRVVAARIGMGRPRVVAAGRLLESGRDLVHVTLVDVGNPHCVLQVPAVGAAPVTTLGPRLERHPEFPRGSNIEFLALRGRDEADLRVWERGCGETQACGSGTVAAAVAAEALGRARLPLRVRLPGGTLVVSRAQDGTIELHGPVVELARGGQPAQLDATQDSLHGR